MSFSVLVRYRVSKRWQIALIPKNEKRNMKVCSLVFEYLYATIISHVNLPYFHALNPLDKIKLHLPMLCQCRIKTFYWGLYHLNPALREGMGVQRREGGMEGRRSMEGRGWEGTKCGKSRKERGRRERAWNKGRLRHGLWGRLQVAMAPNDLLE